MSEISYFTLAPKEGWEGFSRNEELADHIYDSCLPKVNDDGWSYINPMGGMGIFEAETGNYLCIETYDVGNKNFIIETHAGLNQDKSCAMFNFIKTLEAEFGLVREQRD